MPVPINEKTLNVDFDKALEIYIKGLEPSQLLDVVASNEIAAVVIKKHCELELATDYEFLEDLVPFKREILRVPASHNFENLKNGTIDKLNELLDKYLENEKAPKEINIAFKQRMPLIEKIKKSYLPNLAKCQNIIDLRKILAHINEDKDFRTVEYEVLKLLTMDNLRRVLVSKKEIKAVIEELPAYKKEKDEFERAKKRYLIEKSQSEEKDQKALQSNFELLKTRYREKSDKLKKENRVPEKELLEKDVELNDKINYMILKLIDNNIKILEFRAKEKPGLLGGIKSSAKDNNKIVALKLIRKECDLQKAKGRINYKDVVEEARKDLKEQSKELSNFNSAIQSKRLKEIEVLVDQIVQVKVAAKVRRNS